MYTEETKNVKGGVELKIDFGKNMMGLSDELIRIGNQVYALSQENHVYLRASFIDELDDVYSLTFFLKPKE